MQERPVVISSCLSLSASCVFSKANCQGWSHFLNNTELLQQPKGFFSNELLVCAVAFILKTSQEGKGTEK